MKIEILSRGCSKCETLEMIVREIVEERALSAEIVKVTDVNKMIDYGVMLTPGLIVNGEIKVTGRLPSRTEIEEMLTSK